MIESRSPRGNADPSRLLGCRTPHRQRIGRLRATPTRRDTAPADFLTRSEDVAATPFSPFTSRLGYPHVQPTSHS
ncbi:unnamed protein product [Hydatigera taeniaeformis]|uniref:DUF1534 domain-containing protein n=1 Tax=Hydatigena taeniaeformis TaxID=6205 RepID=A0A0R3WMS9_HYDTA|nr:unnamed protein product [Hydatigera taeniaeformis]